MRYYHAEHTFCCRIVPFAAIRATVFLMPSVNCLVELTEMPFAVVTLADIEIVNLERVGFNLKNFDMAIVFKDFTRDVRKGLRVVSDSGRHWKGSC